LGKGLTGSGWWSVGDGGVGRARGQDEVSCLLQNLTDAIDEAGRGGKEYGGREIAVKAGDYQLQVSCNSREENDLNGYHGSH
jgi:hypothetical protein